MTKRIPVIIGLSVLGCALSLPGCKRNGDAVPAPAAGASGKPGQGRGGPTAVVVEQVRLQPWTDTLRAIGTVKARESVTVTAKVSETVQAVHFESGQWVAKGAPLVSLSGQQQQAALTAAQASANEAEQLYRRQATLAQQQLIARAMLDSQKATRDAAAAQVAQIRANLADRIIRAPFAGVLGIRQISPGALVTPGSAIATLDAIDRVYVDFPIPESQLAQVAAGQALTGSSAAFPGREFSGTVQVVAARVDAGSRAMTVRGEFPNADRALRPGMLMEVRVARGEAPAIVVPEIAVQQVGSETFVWRVKPDDTVEKAAIEVAERIPGKVHVAKGIAEGERIVTEGVGKLKAGGKIRAVTPEAPPAAASSPSANAARAGAPAR